VKHFKLDEKGIKGFYEQFFMNVKAVKEGSEDKCDKWKARASIEELILERLRIFSKYATTELLGRLLGVNSNVS